MNSLFLNYEQSLKLKELGFNEECLGEYLSDGNFYILGKQDIYSSNFPGFKLRIKAPLYQQAFNFILNKLEKIDSKYFLAHLYIFSDSSGKFITRLETEYCFNSLEEGINVGIKLLEEVYEN